jgi:hypothetical protein
MRRLMIVFGVGATLATAGAAYADEGPPPKAIITARAHLIYRPDPKARPIEGETTVLQAVPPPSRDRRTEDGSEGQIVIVSIAQH